MVPLTRKPRRLRSVEPRRRSAQSGVIEALRLLSGRVLVGGLLVLIWQLIATSGVLASIVSRTPAQVAHALGRLASNGELWPALWATLSATLIALVLASLVGIVTGVALGLSPRFERYVEPYLNAANAMPRIALAPVFIIYFGIGQTGKVALAFSIVVFVLIVNARAGVRSVDRDLILLARAMNMSRPSLVLKIVLPAAVPSIFAGLRLGMIYSLLGVTASELIASKVGLGQLIAGAAGTFDMATAYAVMLVLAFIGAIINILMAAVEQRMLRWQT